MPRKKSIPENEAEATQLPLAFTFEAVAEAIRPEVMAGTKEYKKNDEAELISAQAKGKWVKEMRDKLPPDLYLAWLRDEADLTEMEANRYINKYALKEANVTHAAAEMLSKISASPMVRQAALALGEQGERVDSEKVRDLEESHAPTQKVLDREGFSKKWRDNWRRTQKALLKKLVKMRQEFSDMDMTEYDMRDVLLSANQDNLFNVDKFFDLLADE